MDKRPSWDDYFLTCVNSIALRSTCDRGKPGCIFVKDNQILATGYAGSPPGFDHCDEAGHLMEERRRFIDVGMIEGEVPPEYDFNEFNGRWETPVSQHCVRTIHAEINAILQAAKKGVSLEGSTVYVTFTPCYNCAMALISLNVKRIVCQQRYQKGTELERMFDKAGIKIEFKKDNVLKY